MPWPSWKRLTPSSSSDNLPGNVQVYMTQVEISLQFVQKEAGELVHKPDTEKCSSVEGKGGLQRAIYTINSGENDHTQQSADPRTAEQTVKQRESKELLNSPLKT